MSVQLHNEAEQALARISLRDALDEALDCQWQQDESSSSDDEVNPALLQKRRDEREERRIRNLQRQWEEIEAVRSAA